MKNKMVWRLLAYFGIVIILFSGVLSISFFIISWQHTLEFHREIMEKKAIAIAETLASFEETMDPSSSGSDRNSYMNFLDRLMTEEVWVVDQDMGLVISGHCPLTSCSEFPRDADDIVHRVFQGETTYGHQFSNLLDSPSLTVGVPVQTSAGISAAVLLHSPTSGIDEAVHQSFTALCLGAAPAIILAGVAAFLLSNRFITPLRRMRGAAILLAKGDYSVETGIEQSDEIGQLAKTIDLLAAQLAKSKEEQAALDQMKQEFISNVSHELRTPVAVLSGFLEILQNGAISEDEDVYDYYNQMLAQGKHLERLVNDLSDLSRLRDLHFLLDIAEINLCEIVRDCARSIRPAIRAKGVTLNVDCPESECTIKGDYVRIRQLLFILLDNAIKFSQNQSSVNMILCRKDDHISLAVCNQGKQITSEELPHLFDRFYRSTGPDNPDGTGLGLSIAKLIALRHNADITAESSAERTKFQIKFFFCSQPQMADTNTVDEKYLPTRTR